jgi:hypothetical protein
MNIERSFLFAFKTPKAAQKLILGAVCSMLFFTVFFAFVMMGYLIRILCDALEGRDAKLPDWKNLSGLFHEGLEPVLVTLTYLGPLVILILLELLLSSLVGSSQVVFTLFSLLRFGYYVIISAIIPLALIRLVVIGSFKSAFHLERIFEFIKANTGNFLTAWGLSLALGLVASVIGFFAFFGNSILLGIAFFFMLFIANVIAVHLYAGAYRASAPFADDHEGDVRASITMPPPLHR